MARRAWVLCLLLWVPGFLLGIQVLVAYMIAGQYCRRCFQADADMVVLTDASERSYCPTQGQGEG